METPGAPRLDKVRHALKKMETKRNEFLFEKHAIGRVSNRRRDIVKELASISNRKVPFKWQRGNKIGKIEILSVIHFQWHSTRIHHFCSAVVREIWRQIGKRDELPIARCPASSSGQFALSV